MLVVGASTLGLGLGAAGVSAEAVQAKSPKKILLKNPLSKPSSALPALTGNGFSGSFVKGKFLLQNSGTSGYLHSDPIFAATGAQLAAISTDIDVSPATPATLAGLNCRSGDIADNRYVFLIHGNGKWLVGKTVVTRVPPNTILASGSVKAQAHETFHLRFECSGPEQPGPTGTVTLKFFINGKRVAMVTDAMSAWPVALPAAVGFEVEGAGAASFSNITVAQL
jgi:hypothetical protein